ncbi:DUF2793 domain-containing protein [Sphingomonas sp.]|uniref:DUF2793 domain-containing protein n=1 Tax=Sphingomonas sp. TaxID=28214 RepID=UPI0025EC3501|nr:DUF2793 domain-containing protein [Sphingomonas sp.]
MSETTPRLSMPLLQAGQAQKEVLHNEAITLLDALVAGVVEGSGDNDPPLSPAPGSTWIIGSAPSGDWTGQAGAVALWTAGGWRFVAAREGMSFRLRDSELRIECGASGWGSGAVHATSIVVDGEQTVGPRLSGISDPAGGAIVDAEARGALAAILVALRTHGLIGS